MEMELDDWPKLQPVFQRLLSGYHISSEDFDLYHDLQDRETDYNLLFQALGYTLKSDPRGFYHFLPDAERAMNTTTRKMALLMFAMVEALADEGQDPVAVIRKGSQNVRQLSEKLFEKQEQILTEGGLDSPDAVEKCFVNNFVGLGFASLNGDALRFRPPVNRFLDVCAELGRQGTAEASEDTVSAGEENDSE